MFLLFRVIYFLIASEKIPISIRLLFLTISQIVLSGLYVLIFLPNTVGNVIIPRFKSSVFKEHEPRRFYYKYLEILKDANIQNADFHTLRHTFATRAIENVMDINTLSAILGHAQTSTTVNRYCHAIEEYKKIGMEKVAYIFTNNNK